MFSVLISINPKWCELIASGKKTVEVRKTKPTLETPFKVYIYCTQNTPYNPVIPLKYEKEGGYIYIGGKRYAEFLTGKVIGEFVCDCMTSFKAMGDVQALYNETKETCLSHDEIIKYSNGKRLYYWHISDLVIYDKPRELSDFIVAGYCNLAYTPVKRPPQSWRYVLCLE